MLGTWEAWVYEAKSRHDQRNAPVVGNPGTFQVMTDQDSRTGMRLSIAVAYAEGAIGAGAMTAELHFIPEGS